MSDFSWSVYNDGNGKGVEIIADKLVLDTPELSVNSQMLLDIPNQGNSFLSLSGKAQLRDASKAYYYYPTQYMGEDLIAYLQAGLQAGQAKNAQLLWFGEFAQYPYNQGDGIFQAKLTMRDGQFSFDPEWLPITDLNLGLLFENDDLWLGPGRGELGKVAVQSVSGNLLNLSDAETVVIDAKFASDGRSAIELINQSPLDSLKKTFVDTQIRDALTGSLHLNIPLTDAEVSLSGDIELRDNTVYLQPLDLTLEHVKAKVEFTESIVHSPLLQAKLWQQPVTATLDIADQGTDFNIDIGLQGRWNSADVLPLFAPVLTEQISGYFDWQGKVNVRVGSDDKLNYNAEILTELTGVNSELPLPFYKTAEDTWPTRVELVGGLSQSDLLVNLRDDVELKVALAHDEKNVSMLSSHVNVGDVTPLILQQNESSINIALDSLDVISWSDWYNRLDRGQLDELQSQDVDVLPTQIQIMEALGQGTPDFAHHSLLTGPQGEALSKRLGTLALRDLRKNGVAPMAILSLMARLGSSDPVELRETIEEVVAGFDMRKFGSAPTKFDADDLAPLTARWLAARPYGAVAEAVAALGVPAQLGERFWNVVRENIASLEGMADWWAVFRDGAEPQIAEEDAEFVPQALALLGEPPYADDTWGTWTAAVKEATGRKGKGLFMPLRHAVTGQTRGPEMADVMPLLQVKPKV